MEGSKPVDELDLVELHVRLDTIMKYKPEAPDRVWEEIMQQEIAETLHYIHRILCMKP